MEDKVEFVSDDDIPCVEKHIRDTSISGTEVFGFKTPKRHGALTMAAASAIHKRTPHLTRRKQTQGRKTPRATKTDRKRNHLPLKVEEVRSEEIRQCSVEAHTNNGKENNISGYCLRRGRQAKFIEGAERESDSEQSDSQSLGPDETVSRPLSNTAGKGNESLTNATEEYFYQQSSKCLTSDHTLSKLQVPHMDQQNMLCHLSEVGTTHPRERFNIYHKLQTLFNKWIFHLKSGFNILLYGLGSKRVLLDQFRFSKLGGCTQLVVNGFFPSLTIKHVLSIITDEILGCEGSFRSLTDQCEFIKQGFSTDDCTEELYVIIHNIDGSMLRSRKCQTVLSLLAEVDAIHIIASIDHINAPLIWNHTQLGRFNWSWFDVTSYEPYKEETSYENSLLVQQTGALALSSLVHVFRSLTPNACGIFLLISRNQLEEKDNTSYIGLSFAECYTKCREQFLVNSELTLRAQLTEFRDHKLIRSKKGTDGVEYLHIPVDASTLKQFVEDQ